MLIPGGAETFRLQCGQEKVYGRFITVFSACCIMDCFRSFSNRRISDFLLMLYFRCIQCTPLSEDFRSRNFILPIELFYHIKGASDNLWNVNNL